MQAKRKADQNGLKYTFNYISCILLLSVYGFYSVGFVLLHQQLLFFVCLFGVLISLFCLWLVRVKLSIAGGFLSTFTIMVTSSILVLKLGWESGFQYYLLCLCPLIFLSGIIKMRLKITVNAVCIALFILLGQTDIFGMLPSETFNWIAEANNLFIFASISIIIFHYSHAVRKHDFNLRAVNTKLSTLAETDQLTGLYNRRYILKAIEQEMALYEINQKPFTVAIADVDDFKKINDCFGHNEGDKALSAIAQNIKSVLRKEDVVARWGGEEFIFLLPQTSLAQSLIAMEKVRNAISRLNMFHQKYNYSLTVTIGVSTYNGRQKLKDLFKRADSNLYAGKQSGKNKAVA